MGTLQLFTPWVLSVWWWCTQLYTAQCRCVRLTDGQLGRSPHQLTVGKPWVGAITVTHSLTGSVGMSAHGQLGWSPHQLTVGGHHTHSQLWSGEMMTGPALVYTRGCLHHDRSHSHSWPLAQLFPSSSGQDMEQLLFTDLLLKTWVVIFSNRWVHFVGQTAVEHYSSPMPNGVRSIRALLNRSQALFKF